MPHRKFSTLLSILCIVITAQAVDLSLKTWGPNVFADYDARNMKLFYGKTMATSNGKGIVTGTSSALAVHVATDALQKGVNAIDAAIAASAAQIVVAGGCYVSFAGIFHAMIYEAATGKVHYLNGNYNSVLNETNPLTIPPVGSPPFGRQVLVPGYMRAIESAHNKFGTPGVSFADLLQPSIDLAVDGFSWTPLLYGNLKSNLDVIKRTPQGLQIFDPSMKMGQTFKQPVLADLLRNVAQNGADYMYTGPWAQNFVNNVQAAGGFMSMEDTARYQPLWGTPRQSSPANDSTTILWSPGEPSYGGVQIAESLKLADQFQSILRSSSPYDKSAESLFWTIQMARWSNMVETVSEYYPVSLQLAFPDIDLTHDGRVSTQTAQQVYAMMTAPNGTDYIRNQFIRYFYKHMFLDGVDLDLDPRHSDGLVVADAAGNVISIVHSINTKPWGTGLFVDGIALPDSAAIQKQAVNTAGLGGRVPDPVEPNIVTRDGKPVLASASIGGAEREVMFQSMLSTLLWGRSVKQANDAPHFLGMSGATIPGGYMYSQKIASGLFDPALISKVQSMGQPIKVVPGGSQPTSQGDPGYWVSVQVSPEGQYTASAPYTLNGLAEGL